MWHEARKQERKIRGLMIDYKRRAERRRDYYEKIRADPTQFLQLHGRPCKIHLDPSVALAADSPATMMSWQGDRDILIDRFDVRAHLDFIPEVKNTEIALTEDEAQEERFQNYERYRILVQNEFLGINEEKFFSQLALEEQFGPVTKNESSVEGKKKSALNAAIGYKYDDVKPNTDGKKQNMVEEEDEEEEDDEEDDDSDFDFDLSVDVAKVDTANANELNKFAHHYGMESNDYFSFLTRDSEEAENLKLAREEEEEKALFSGRKSRKERRAFRERSTLHRKTSPPSYATTKNINPSYGIKKEVEDTFTKSDKSKSRSLSPVNSGKIMYITSFGDKDEEPSTSKEKTKEKTYSKKRSRSPSKHRSYSSRYKRSKSSSRYSSKSRSRTRSPYSHRSSKPSFKSSSKSRSPKKYRPSESSDSSPDNSAPAPPVKRYYGRNVQNSSSELELSDSDSSSNSKPSSSSKSLSLKRPSNKISQVITPQERLRRKRQKLLNKQFKADKKAEKEKIQKIEQERLDRAEEMRELTLRLRSKEKYKSNGSDEDWDDDDDDDKKSYSSKTDRSSRSRSRSSSQSKSKSRYKSIYSSKSRSPLLETPINQSSDQGNDSHSSRYSSNYNTRDYEMSGYRGGFRDNYNSGDWGRNQYREDSSRGQCSYRGYNGNYGTYDRGGSRYDSSDNRNRSYRNSDSQSYEAVSSNRYDMSSNRARGGYRSHYNDKYQKKDRVYPTSSKRSCSRSYSPASNTRLVDY